MHFRNKAAQLSNKKEGSRKTEAIIKIRQIQCKNLVENGGKKLVKHLN